MEKTDVLTWGEVKRKGALARQYMTVSNIIVIRINEFQFGIAERVPYQLHPDDIHYMD